MYASRPKAQHIFERLVASVPADQTSRALGAIFLVDFFDHLRRERFPEDWLDRFDKSIDECLDACRFLLTRLDRDHVLLKEVGSVVDGSVEYKTGKVYYELWKDFDNTEYYDHARTTLAERLSKNGISVNGFVSALDDGCGSGRYTVALKNLGCGHVTGVDISENSVAFAKTMNPYGDDVSFLQASVLDLPFADEFYDLVFSNGVLHHTKDTKQGLGEIYRVLKTGGSCWLYLYGGKDSFFWDSIDCCRLLLQNVPQSYTASLMKILGYGPGRIFHRNDFFYVPIHNRYSQKEVEELLASVGFVNFRRLTRGASHDWDEITHNNPHIDPYIYGEGEMRYWIEK